MKWITENKYSIKIPHDTGVYAIYVKDDFQERKKLMYIGRAGNLRTRLCGHMVLRTLSSLAKSGECWFTAIYIKYQINKLNSDELESSLIKKLSPIINRLGTERNK